MRASVPRAECAEQQGQEGGAEGGDGDDQGWESYTVGSSRAYKVEGLHPATEYTFRLRFVETETQKLPENVKPSAVVTITTPTAPPGPPRDVKLAQRVKNALKITWEPPQHNGGSVIKYYRVFIYPPPVDFQVSSAAEAENFVCVHNGLQTTCRISKLRPGFPYQIHVQAMNSSGYGEFSEVAMFTTAASTPLMLNPPSPIMVSRDSVTLAWEEPYGQGSAVSSYSLEKALGTNGVPVWKFVADVTETTYTVTGLSPGHTYRFRMRAQNEVGYSPYCAPFAVVTSATVPDAVPKPIESMHTTTSITVAWGAVPWDGGSPVLSYELEFQAPWAGEAGKVWQPVYQGLSNECTVTHLRPGSAYRMRLRAVNTVGPGEYSHPADGNTQATAPMGPPENLLVSHRTADKLTFEWSVPLHDGGRAIKAYSLQIANVPEGMPQDEEYMHYLEFNTVLTGNVTSASVENLSPGRSFYARVNAENCYGVSEWSKPVFTCTRCAPPEMPKPPGLVDAPKARTLSLTWSTPHCNGAAITSYNLLMADLGPILPLSKSDQAKPDIMAMLQSMDEAVPLGVAISSDQTEAMSRAGSTDLGGIQNSAKSEEGEPCGSAEEEEASPRELSFVSVHSGPEKFVEVHDLRPYSNYAFCLQACNPEGGSEWSDWSLAKFATTAAAPSSPLELCVVDASQSHVTLQWMPPQMDNGASVVSYLVEMTHGDVTGPAKNAKGAKWEGIYTGPHTMCTVSDLESGVRLSFRVRANSTVGTSPPSSPTSAVTIAGCPCSPGAPTFSNLTNVSVKVKWAPPASDNGAAITGYLVHYAQDTGESECNWSVVATNGPVCTLKLGRLQALTRYRCSVQAVSTKGNSPLSMEAMLTTLKAAPLAPANVWAEARGCGSVFVSWDESLPRDNCAPATSYILEMARAMSSSSVASPNDGEANSFRTVYSDTGLSHEVTGLKPGTTYRFRVRANGGMKYGPGPATPAIFATTDESVQDAQTGVVRERIKKGKRRNGETENSEEGMTSSSSFQHHLDSLRNMKDEMLHRIGCEDWMSEERREKVVAEAVAERQRAAASSRTTLRPPKVKRWYDKLFKQARRIAYLITIVVALFLALFLCNALAFQGGAIQR